MGLSFSIEDSGGTLQRAVEYLRAVGDAVDADDILDTASAIILDRTRTRFLKETNPDGSMWPQTKSAAIRRAGGYTFAKGGPYAPGGWKTGTGSLFSSGNLFHSIQLVRRDEMTRAIQTDVPYAIKYQDKRGYTIIGASDADLTLVSAAIVRRIERARP